MRLQTVNVTQSLSGVDTRLSLLELDLGHLEQTTVDDTHFTNRLDEQ